MRVLNGIWGALMVIAGIIFIAHPFTSLLALGCFIGAVLMVGGINSLVSAGRETRSAWDVVLGILSIIAGMFILVDYIGSIMAVNVVVIFLAITILLSGITRIMESLALKKLANNMWGLVLASGILSVILSILLFANPFTGMLMIEAVIGVTVIMQGINYIAAAITGRPVVDEIVVEEQSGEEQSDKE